MRIRASWMLLGLVVTRPVPAAEGEFRTIFDGTARGWVIAPGQPIKPAAIEPDGLNPHKAGAYIAFYEKPVYNFVLELDYKLTRRCNSGVFLRTGDMKDPVMTGLEVAIDDTPGAGLHDSGAFYDLVRPRVNAQKPAGGWNHLVVTARGPKLVVELNGQPVSEINLDEFSEPGRRPDGSRHKFTNVAIKDLNRKGYIGVQDHGSDCWYKNIRLKELD